MRIPQRNREPEIVQHVTDDMLELYAMHTFPESETGPLEEHQLVCGDCRDRLEAEIAFVTAMGGAAAKIR